MQRECDGALHEPRDGRASGVATQTDAAIAGDLP
jgi:hypothetical protein